MSASLSFIEKPSMRALCFLKHLSFNKFKAISAKKCKNEEDRFLCFNKMKHYVKSALDNKGVMVCNYEYSSTTPKLLGGRLFANNSIQQIACEIRGLLFLASTCKSTSTIATRFYTIYAKTKTKPSELYFAP